MKTARNLTNLGGLAFILSAAACTAASGDDQVKPSVELIDRTKAAITTAEGLASINGTYGDKCQGHVEGAPWSVALDGSNVPNELTVTKNDSDCVLSVTAFVNAQGSFTAISPISMSDAYGSAKAFLDSEDAFKFYGNAKLDSTAFANDFTITLLVSDVPDVGSEEQTSSYAQVHASAVTASDVLPPNDSLDLSSIHISVDVDDVIQSFEGAVQVSAGSRAAEAWFIVPSLPEEPTFIDVNQAYQAASPTQFSDEGSRLLPASLFIANGDDLTGGISKWLVLRRNEGGVPAYKAVKITFKP